MRKLGKKRFLLDCLFLLVTHAIEIIITLFFPCILNVILIAVSVVLAVLFYVDGKERFDYSLGMNGIFLYFIMYLYINLIGSFLFGIK